MHNYQVVKLTNNTVIVGDVEQTPEDVMILNPLEIMSKPITNDEGKVIGEQMVLRPLLVMTTDNNVVIDSYNILFYNRLDERLINTYREMVNTVYDSDKISYDGSAYVEQENEASVPEKESMTKEEAEYMMKVLEGLGKKDETYH